jgi:tetratricopeptide (TPR) repeat protein
VTSRGRNRYDVDRVAVLDDELAGLVRALDDLDAERARGELAPDSYERLHAAYTARTAEAVRERTRTSARRTLAPRRGRRERVVAAGLLAGCLAVAAVAAGGTTHQRAPGEAITGSTPTRDSAQPTPAGPDDVAAHDARAASLMQDGDVVGALREFDEAVRLDPQDAVALSYSGWIAYLAGSPQKALPRLTQAVAADPAYPDAHAFRGIVLLRADQDPAAGRAELEQYLRLVPDGPMSEQVKRVLAQTGAAPP